VQLPPLARRFDREPCLTSPENPENKFIGASTKYDVRDMCYMRCNYSSAVWLLHATARKGELRRHFVPVVVRKLFPTPGIEKVLYCLLHLIYLPWAARMEYDIFRGYRPNCHSKRYCKPNKFSNEYVDLDMNPISVIYSVLLIISSSSSSARMLFEIAGALLIASSFDCNITLRSIDGTYYVG